MNKEDKDLLADDTLNNDEAEKDTALDYPESENTEVENGEFEANPDEVEPVENTEQFEMTANEDTVADDENSGYSSQFGELDEFVGDSADTNEATINTEKQRKSLSTKAISIIAVSVLIAVAIIVLGVYFVFFNNSIKSGVWVPVTIDETTNEIVEPEDDTTKQYYEFTETQMIVYYANGYAMSESSCDVKYEGNTFVMQDGTNLSLTYSVSGNLIKGKLLTITIAGYEDQPITYKWAPKLDIPELTGPEFTANKEILGYWKYSNGMNVVFKEFTEDGTTNEYTAFQGTRQKYTQMYNFDGENIVTLSPGGTNMYGETINPGTEETNQAVIEGDKLTLYQGSMPYEFTKSSKEEYDEFEKAVLDGTYEYPTADYSQYEVATETGTVEYEAVTPTEATEEVTEAVTE